jgi:hypothetical protein
LGAEKRDRHCPRLPVFSSSGTGRFERLPKKAGPEEIDKGTRVVRLTDGARDRVCLGSMKSTDADPDAALWPRALWVAARVPCDPRTARRALTSGAASIRGHVLSARIANVIRELEDAEACDALHAKVRRRAG